MTFLFPAKPPTSPLPSAAFGVFPIVSTLNLRAWDPADLWSSTASSKPALSLMTTTSPSSSVNF
eukprot:CAMPEP_0118657480 /NCGR_PEP_ID=MMETSP0785-20121206/14043_1 /TAXON_ID=91992 /ORGANISM="Bolidomonas pacifica, Strain CCMP 1866" /LENGTH=63 /DNA_ID=CAMNT_0006550405 /DNA_START=45 /DNA_END=233 /DNA_ORIENTATION=+